MPRSPARRGRRPGPRAERDHHSQRAGSGIPAAHELTPVAACADTAELTAVQLLPPGASLRQAILTTEARLDDVEALRRTGAYRDALARIPVLVDEARERAYAPTLARALELHCCGAAWRSVSAASGRITRRSPAR